MAEMYGWSLGTCVAVSRNHKRKRLHGWTGRVLRWVEEEGKYLVGLDLSDKTLLLAPDDLVQGLPGTKPHRPMRPRRRGARR